MKVTNNPITKKEMIDGTEPTSLTENSLFAPSTKSQKPSIKFEGKLSLKGAKMFTNSTLKNEKVNNKNVLFFPDVTLEFFTVDDTNLVPVTQDVIPNGTLKGKESYWDIIVQPGRVWSDPDKDDDWNRASFPFSLVNRLEGESHIGIAMFLYKEEKISNVRFQIVAQTGPFHVSDYFNSFGVTEAVYTPQKIANLQYHEKIYHYYVKNKFPTAELNELKSKVGRNKLDGFDGAADETEEGHILQTGLLYNGVLYKSPCHFAAGPFPYSDEVRYGVWSVTKTAMMNVAMLRLAQKYGAEILSEKISTYISIPEHQKKWNDVSFLDLANMASGYGATEEDPTCYLCDYNRWYLAPTKEGKISEALDYPHVWSSGKKYNYRDQDAFILGVALEEFLRSKEGSNASLDEMLMKEVYKPIGIHYAPANHSIEKNGSDGHIRMDFGFYATLDELAKIGLLYEKQGEWNDIQILHRELVNDILPKKTPPDTSVAKEIENKYGHKYYAMNWHIEPYDYSDKGKIYLPNMKGYGGNLVTLLPGEIVGLRIANIMESTEEFDSTVSQAKLAEQLTSFNDKI